MLRTQQVSGVRRLRETATKMARKRKERRQHQLQIEYRVLKGNARPPARSEMIIENEKNETEAEK